MKMGPQEDYIETVFTCKGDFNDPNLQLQLEEFHEGLRGLLLSETCKEELILKKVEPWNSVRVTFNIPRAAALKLKQLAQQGDTSLRRLGVLAVQIEGDQSISLTIAGKNNERTELVFKTGVGETASDTSTSVLAGSNAESTPKQSLDYLRQSNLLLDPLLNHLGAGGDLLQSPNVVATSSDPIPFLSAGITTVATIGKLPGLEHSPLQGMVFPPGRSPTGYPNSPSPSFVPMGLGKNVGHIPSKYSSYGHGRQGMTALPRQTIGNLVLPPPPSYQHPHVVSVNNVQKQNRPMTSSSPLLVNLLQNDPSGGLLNNFTQGKLPDLFDGTLEALALAKKKRRRRKKKRLAAEAAARQAALFSEGLTNTDITSTPHLSLPGFNKDIKKSKFSSQSCGLPADHSAPLTELGPETASGKLVNPYTGLLEPAEEPSGETALSSTQAAAKEPEKVDTIQSAINRVADAWISHVPSLEATTSTGTLNLVSSSFISVSTPAPLQSMVSPAELPAHSLPCSTSTYLSPVSSGAPSNSIGTAMDTLTSSSVCDRPSSDPLSRPYDINFTMINTSSVSSMAESLHREPLMAMQHVTNSVGLSSSSSPWHAGPVPPLSSTSHMQTPFSNTCMQDSLNPNLSHGTSKMPQMSGDQIDSNSGNLSVRSMALEKSRSFQSSLPVEGHHAAMRHHSRTPPHSKSGSLPMSYQVERPRSTGSYPLSQLPDDKGLGPVSSGISIHTATVASSSANSIHALVGRYRHAPVQSMVQCVSSSGSSVKPATPQMFSVNHAHIEMTNKGVLQTDLSRKGSDEINNSNHDSGLSSQSEATDENHLTDETASSCGTQGSPPLNATEAAAKVDQPHGKVKPVISKPAVLPTSAHNPVILSGNTPYHKDMRVIPVVSSSESLALNTHSVDSSNPTVLHWNTKDNMAGTNVVLSAAKDTQQVVQHQKNAPLQSTFDKELLAKATCESLEHAKSLETALDRGKLSHHVSGEGQAVSCHGEVTKLSVGIAALSAIRETSASLEMRDRNAVSVLSARRQGYSTSGVPISLSAGDAYGNCHKDVHLANPGLIMSSSVYHGPEEKCMGPKPFLQPSAIVGVPNLSDLRTSKLLDKSPSALSESRAVTHSLRMKLHKTPAQNILPVMSSSSIVRGHNPYTDSVPRLTAPVHHSVPTSTVHYSNPSVDSFSSCSNSHGVIPVSVASHIKTVSGQHSQLASPALGHNHNVNYRTSVAGSASVGSPEALKTLQNYMNPVNVQMCNTSSPSMTSNFEAASNLVKSMSTVVTQDQLVRRPSYSHNAIVTQTITSHSGHPQLQIPVMHSERETNGPVHARDNQDLQNCHVSDFLNDASDSLESNLVKCDSTGFSQLSSLPLISNETLDQELPQNCLPSEVIDERVDISSRASLSSERNVMQRGILAGGRSPGHSTALLSSSPDQLKGSNVTSMYTRKSPTAKSGGGLSMLSMFASDLPLPKLLTESMLKVVKPLPGSAKDIDGSLKVARRNQGTLHTNLHTHSSTYSKSPPLSYESVQGAGSVLTPPKSPVRFGQADSMSVPQTKAQSPRSWNQHVSQAASNSSPHPPISSSASVPVSERLPIREQSQHNGQEEPTANHVSDSPRNVDDNAPVTKTSLGASSVSPENKTQPAVDGELTITETAAEVVPTQPVHSCNESDSNKMPEVSSNESVSTLTVTQSESMHDQPSGIGQVVAQDPANVPEQGNGVEQDLCKANESCQPPASGMQPMSLPENPQAYPENPVSGEVKQTVDLITQTFPSPTEEPVAEISLTDENPELVSDRKRRDMVLTPEIANTSSNVEIDKESSDMIPQSTEGDQSMAGVQNVNPAGSLTPVQSIEVTAEDVRSEHSYTGSNIALMPSTNSSEAFLLENHIAENVGFTESMHCASNDVLSDHDDVDLTQPEIKSDSSYSDTTDGGIHQTSTNPSDMSGPCTEQIDTPAVNDVTTPVDVNCDSSVLVGSEVSPLASSTSTGHVNHSKSDVESSLDTPENVSSGKPLEKEVTRQGRLAKTPKQKNEDNGNKTSPENETSPQLRQRRSRRRLTDTDGNGAEVAGIKRSKIDGHEDVEYSDSLDNDHESNDTGSKHNDVHIGESGDHSTTDDGHLVNSHLHKPGPDDKAAARLSKKGPEAIKHVLRDTKREGKQNVSVPENDLKGRGRAADRVLKANEDEHVTRSSRRSRLSPSTGAEKPATQAGRDRSPVRGTRNKTPDQIEESPEPQFKRTTRSTKPKEHTEPVTASNRRRRASRDHR